MNTDTHLPCDGQVIRESWDTPERFRLIFDRHYRDVCRFLSYKTSAAEAEELASEVFVTAFNKRRSFRIDEASARPWLFQIAMHNVMHASRSKSRMARAYGRLRVLRHDDEQAADHVVQRIDATDTLSRALAELPEVFRDVVLLVAGAGFSYDEAAAVLDIPVGTVRSRYSRARSRLQTLLTPTPAGDNA